MSAEEDLEYCSAGMSFYESEYIRVQKQYTAALRLIGQMQAALIWSREGFLIHAPKAVAYIKRIDEVLTPNSGETKP